MGKVADKEYIKIIGKKQILCKTGMDNTISILNNGKKYKEFSKECRDLRKKVNQEFAEDLILQSDYYGHSVVSFPEFVVKDEKKLYGIISDFEEGVPLLEIPKEVEISYLIYLVDYIERGIKDISEIGWRLEDLHEENILINLNSSTSPAKIIDTDYYQLKKIQCKKVALENYRENLKRIFTAVIYSVIPELQISNIWEDSQLRKKYMLASAGLISCTDFLREILVSLQMYDITGKNIETLQKSI